MVSNREITMTTINCPKTFESLVVVNGVSSQVSKSGHAYQRLEFLTLASKESDGTWVLQDSLDSAKVNTKVFNKVYSDKWLYNNVVLLTFEHRIKDVTEYLEEDEVLQHTETRDEVVGISQIVPLQLNRIHRIVKFNQDDYDMLLSSLNEQIRRELFKSL